VESLNKNTKEIISFELTDRLNNVADLAPYTVEYRVAKEDDTHQIAWAPVENVQLMRVDVLVDTTGVSWTIGSIYRLYIRPLIAPEAPVLGPYEFSLV